MATDAASLLQQGKCYTCLDHKQRSIAELALLAQILVASKTMADVSPAGLMQFGKCYQCLTAEEREIAALSLLALVVAGGSSGVCIIGGVGPPTVPPPCNWSVYIQRQQTPSNPPNLGLWLGDTVTGWSNAVGVGPPP